MENGGIRIKWNTKSGTHNLYSFISLDILFRPLLMMHTLLHMRPPLINKLKIAYINSLMSLPFISITLILILFLSFSYFSQLFYQILNFKKMCKNSLFISYPNLTIFFKHIVFLIKNKFSHSFVQPRAAQQIWTPKAIYLNEIFFLSLK